jgi:hypothetical protein
MKTQKKSIPSREQFQCVLGINEYAMHSIAYRDFFHPLRTHKRKGVEKRKRGK